MIVRRTLFIAVGTRDLHSHLRLHRYPDRVDSLRRCRHRQLLGEQGTVHTIDLLSTVDLQGTALLTVDQRRWLDLKGRIKLVQPLRTPPRPQNSTFRSYVFDITRTRWFKKSSAILVLLNCALLYKPWKANEQITQISAMISSLFTFLFLVEAVMKCTALGFIGYWQSRRNRFDLLVTILGIAWIILNIISFGKNELVRPVPFHEFL